MLKRLELMGFKSFADKTVFEFGDGITGIVGPNGSGKCVIGDTLVTLADGREIPIRELVDDALQATTHVEMLADGVLTKQNQHSIEVLTLNPITLRLEPRSVAAFVKREAPASLLRIRTQSGREITATPYHPLFTLRNGQLQALKASELQVGVRVALPRCLPVQGVPGVLAPWELLQQFQENDLIYVPASPALAKWAAACRPQTHLKDQLERWALDRGIGVSPVRPRCHAQARRLCHDLTPSAPVRQLREYVVPSTPGLDIVPGVTRLVKEAVQQAGIKLKPHRRRIPRLAAYWENRCEATRLGLLEILRYLEELGEIRAQAREPLAQLATLATSDVYWDEVVSIEEVPPPDAWVYDLCVAETHNFVANNIIVHNSNVVDAVRWILGEQSAKSLRGGEMTDVIFNGSASRRSLGLAEVTMTFDNQRRSLATEAQEVQITRRVYRSGEGEYLINQQLCRLKDIKDLFLGSGAGTDAYCIIEQGRVDVLLQASTKDRRTIFEEAAGISRFKARKTETLRKLERVDQNVQRLRDIIDEVEKQLRSVKLQAAKAQRYQEYTAQLKELRVGLSLQEYHQHSGQLESQSQRLEQQKGELEARTSQASGWEAEAQRLEGVLAELDEQLHGQEALLAEARQHIKTAEGTLGHEGTVSADLEAERTRTQGRLAELHGRVAELTAGMRQVGQELATAETQGEQQRAGVRLLEEGLRAAGVRLAELEQQKQADGDDHLKQIDLAAHHHNDAVGHKALMDALRGEHERKRLRTAQAAQNLASLDVELEELTEAEAGMQRQLAEARQALADQKQQRERFRQLHNETSELLSQMRQQRSGLASRVEVLEGLERSHEGLSSGVREVFRLLEQPEPGPWGNVLGMIADFLTVRREYAPLIDVALGDWSQRFLVRDVEQLADALARRSQPFSGRVSFLPLHEHTGEHRPQSERRHNRLLEMSLPGRVRMPVSAAGTPAHPGVVAPAVTVVSCDHPELSDLPMQLLERTLIVRDLVSARAIAAHTSGYRLVTLQGELLEPDGTLTVGTHHAETGILSRKSELRELRQQILELDRRLTETERDLIDLRGRIGDLDVDVTEKEQETAVLADQAADLRARLEQHRHQRQDLHEAVAFSRDEIGQIERDILRLEQLYQTASAAETAAKAQAQAVQQRLRQAEREIHEIREHAQQRQQEYTHAKVMHAKVEERLSGLRAQCQQRAQDLQQRRAEQAEGQEQVRGLQTRLTESQRTMLQASAALALHYLHKEAAERRVGELAQQRALQRQERTRLANLAQQIRQEWRTQQEQVHAYELQVNELRHRLGSLADRLREDYQLELAQLYREFLTKLEAIPEAVPLDEALPEGAALAEPPSAAEAEAIATVLSLNPTEANEEIAELRKKLNRLGSVNLDSLQELSDLETRAGTLQAQFDDLTAAKRSLEEIIAKINTDSRKLFTETFTTIRTHFQELFRKLFGGGMADIVLEDEMDILESGIEIIARPPGKELRSISLMSGGEKTMTAVALLLAIFRSRPSPFCILDEVDAALDEANVGRFTAVLREFLVLSQFIIITHSKKTMATADVLYGITMQESGISKRVSVRFEDWPDDGVPTNGEIPLGAFGGK